MTAGRNGALQSTHDINGTLKHAPQSTHDFELLCTVRRGVRVSQSGGPSATPLDQGRQSRAKIDGSAGPAMSSVVAVVVATSTLSS